MMMAMLYAQVIVKQRTNVSELTYAVPAEIIPYIRVGSLVLAPLRKKTVKGTVTALKRNVPLRLKSAIRELIDIERSAQLNSGQIAVIQRLADYYGASLAEVGFHALNNTPIPAKPGGLPAPKPKYIQAAWGERKAYYANLIKNIDKRSILLIFSQKSFAQSFNRYCLKNGLKVVYDDSRQASKKKLIELQKLGVSWVFITTLQGIFTSLNRGDVLVVDQPEHIGGKFQSRPFMRSKTIAIERSTLEDLSLHMGSILPAIEDVPLFSRKAWTLESLLKKTAPITVTSRQRSPDLLVPGLEAALHDKVESNEKLLVLVLARGWAPALVCQQCGEIVSCNNCGRTSSVNKKKMNCNYCGFTEDIPASCPLCSAGELRTVGEGVGQVVHKLKSKFPRRSVAEYSSDQPLYDDKAQVVVATEKIFSLPDVSFDSVIFLSIDRLLTAAELNSLHELLNYLYSCKQSGAEVLVETYFPDHPIWGVVDSETLRAYYSRELSLRKKYGLPPYGSVFAVVGQGGNRSQLLSQANKITEYITKLFPHVEVSRSEFEKKGNEDQLRLTVYTKSAPSTKQKTSIREFLPPAWHLDMEP